MPQRIRAFLLVLLAISVGTIACLGSTVGAGTEVSARPTVSGETGFELDAWQDAEPNPASIDIQVDGSAAAKATIGREGGTLETTDADGTAYKLTVPAGVLFSPVEITMTPLASASGDPIGDSPIAGVRLEPDGLYFLGAASLEITGDLATADAVGFGAEGQGEDFHLLPIETNAGSVALPILHFSVAGIGKQQLAELAKDYHPSPGANTAWDAMVLLNETNLLPAGIAGVLVTWGGALAKWMAETNDPDLLENQTLEMIAFVYISNLAMDQYGLGGSADKVQALGQQVFDLWLEKVTGAVQNLAGSCKQGKLEDAFGIARWWTIGTFIVTRLPTLDPGDALEGWVQAAKGCFTFDLTWMAEVIAKQGGDSNTVNLNLTGTVPPEDAVPAELIETLLVDHLLNASDRTGQLKVTGGPFGECEGQANDSVIAFLMETEVPNLGEGDIRKTEIVSMTGYVTVNTAAKVTCPELQGVAAPVAEDFFWVPLEKVNQNRVQSMFWRFDLDMNDHSDGAVARFEEKNVKLAGTPSSFTVSQEFTVKPASTD
jgi:hypothetical protein